MAIAITYDPATETVEVTGGIESTPATFADIYEADLNDTLELLAAASGAADNTLSTQIQPADDLALLIDCVVAAKSAEADFIFITGTNAWGEAQTESLDVTAGNGTYTTTLRFRTITNLDCSDNAAGGGAVWANGTIQVVQNRWGVVSPQLGLELVTNGDFAAWDDADTPTGWENSATTGTAGITEVGFGNLHGGGGSGAVNIWTNDGTLTYIIQASILEIGKRYVLSVDVNIGSGILEFTTSGLTFIASISTSGTKSISFTASTSGIGFKRSVNAVDFSIDNVSVKEIIPQYKIDCDIDFGDGATSTYFQSTNEQVYFADGYVFIIKDNATLQIGELDIAGENGSTWSYHIDLNINHIGTVLIYGSSIHLRQDTGEYHSFHGDTTVVDSHITMENGAGTFAFIGQTTHNRVTYSRGNNVITQNNIVVFNDVKMHEISFYVQGTTPNIKVDLTTATKIYVWTANAIIQDPIGFTGVVTIGNTGSLLEQYTCNIHVTDKDGNDLDDVRVTVEDSADPSGDFVFDTTTDPSGNIPEQTIDYKKWEGTDETLTNYSPHTFTFSKAGYPDLIMNNITVDKPLVWEIDMGQSNSDLRAIMETAIDNKINTTGGVVDNVTNVTTVATTTTNTDMVGTDGANTVVPDVAGIAASLHTTTDSNVNSKHTTTDSNVNSKHTTTDGKIDNIPTSSGSPSIGD